MRVVAGTQKGRRLKTPQTLHLRPTSARVREALFSILSDRVKGAQWLDLYAGTGAIGIEALSRGAEHVVFVEPDSSSMRILRENIGRCSYTQSSTVINCEAREFLRPSGASESPPLFDIVFADPPYHETDLEHLLSTLSGSSQVSSQGLIILEHFSKTLLPERIGNLHRSRQSRYGDTTLTFFSFAQGH